MKMKKIIGLLIIFVLILIAGCSHTGDVNKSTTDSGVSSKFPAPGFEGIEEAVVNTESVKEISVTARQWEFDPNPIIVNKGDKIKLSIKSVDVAHGFSLPDFGINKRLEPCKIETVEFIADKSGQFTF